MLSMIITSLTRWERDPEDVLKGDFVYLGVSIDVDVEFKDIRQQEIETIDEEIKNTMAEYENRLSILRGKKQELLALEPDQ